MNRALKSYFFLIVIALFINGLIAALNFKQLYNDGAHWALNIINNSSWHAEEAYYRLFTLILQTPAVLSTNLTDQIWIPTTLFCLGYFLYPFIIMTAIFLKYRKNPKFDYFYICAITFFLSIIPNWAFGVSIVNESIALSWLLLFYILATEKPKEIYILLFSLLLCFTYETAIAYLWLAAYILFREKKLNIKHVLIFLVLTALQIWNVLVNILPKDAHKHFKTSLPESIKSPLFWLATGAALILICMIPKTNKVVKGFFLILTSAFTIFVMTHIWDYAPANFLGFSYYNRVWAIPTSGLILFAGYELIKSNQYQLSKTSLIAMLIICIPGIFYEFNINQLQVGLNKRMKQLVKDKPGCHILTKPEWENLLAGSFVPTWSFVQMSMLYNQSIHLTSVLNTIIYDDYGQVIPNQQCTPQKNSIWVTDQYWSYNIPINRRLDFSQIFKGPSQ